MLRGLTRRILRSPGVHAAPAGGLGARKQRGPFKTLTNADRTALRAILGPDGVLESADDTAAYNTDWMGKYTGHAPLVLRPASTEEVSKVMQYCHAEGIAVVPQGGNTGLVGGSVPVYDELVLSLARMNSVHNVDTVSSTVVCDAGCVLEVLDNQLREHGLMVPLDLGAKGSCHIGGNVATNAGGLRFLRYGSLKASVLGIEAVLADGTVLDTLTSLRKDNTGYDVKQLMIGSEGTLGIITKLAIAVPVSPASVNVACLAASSYQDVMAALSGARTHLGEVLSAFEYLDAEALSMTQEQMSDTVRDPFPDARHPFYMVVETSGSNADHDMDKLSQYLEAMMDTGVVSDGVLAQDETQARGLWSVRESVTESLARAGAVYKYDVSLPVPVINDLVETMRERVAPLGARTVGFGHMGDGNLHLNVSSPQFDPEVLALIEPFVYEWTAQHRGSISAEHGLGVMKPHAIGYSKPPAAVELMHRLKAVLDPKGILNPYKVLQ